MDCGVGAGGLADNAVGILQDFSFFFCLHYLSQDIGVWLLLLQMLALDNAQSIPEEEQQHQQQEQQEHLQHSEHHQHQHLYYYYCYYAVITNTNTPITATCKAVHNFNSIRRRE